MRNRGRGRAIIIPVMSRPWSLLSLLLVLAAVPSFADLHLVLTPSRVAGADGSVPLRLTVVNATPAAAENVRVGYVNAQSSIALAASPDWNCSETFGSVACAMTRPLAAGESATLDLRFHFDQPYGRREVFFNASATVGGAVQSVSALSGAALSRPFTVPQSC